MDACTAVIRSIEEALAAVAEVGPVARAHAQKAEDARGLPTEVVDAIAASGLWRVFAPRCVGGSGLGTLEAQFGIEVPVLFVNGRKAFKYRCSARELRKRLEREK